MTKHIILIGFKNVGKSSIGKQLAKEIDRPFIDLDEELKKAHTAKTGEKLTTRDMIKKHGEPYFRELEHEVLAQALAEEESAVIALGGGAPMHKDSRPLISKHTVILITAPKGIVFERIMINGRPAIFPEGESPLTAFNRIWDERSGIYDQLAQHKIDNKGSLNEAVAKIQSLIVSV